MKTQRKRQARAAAQPTPAVVQVHNLDTLPKPVRDAILARFPGCDLTYRWGERCQVALETDSRDYAKARGFPHSHLPRGGKSHLTDFRKGGQVGTVGANRNIIGIILPHRHRHNEKRLLAAVSRLRGIAA